MGSSRWISSRTGKIATFVDQHNLTMFKKIKIRPVPVFSSLVLVSLLLLFFGARHLDTSRREKVLLESMMKSLSMMHYDPVKPDDQFSALVFDNYLSSLDYNKKFLLKADIDALSAFRNQIDDQLIQREIPFFEAVEGVIVARISDASVYYAEILNSPFNFTFDEEIELDPKKNNWAVSSAALKDEWRKGLKYQVMLRVYQDLEVQESAAAKGDTTIKQRSYEEIEQAARDQVRKTHEDYFDRLMKLTRDDRFGMFLNAISSVYDPHTNYFPPKIKDDFDIAMSGKLEGIGAVLTQRGGYIQVEEIMPGSPSWKQGQLKAGDMILKVAQGDAEPVDVTSMRLDDAVKLIRGKKGTEARLTVKQKLTEELVVISIIRDVVEMEQTWARSAVIKAPDGQRVGYIFLPKFYVDFNNPYTGRSCSEDVRKEIIKLTSEGIDALVFDLRNNGGGSLQDVVKMSGFFIPTGPIVQVKDKLEGLDVMRDVDPSLLYDGPMVVMVNAGSASASEIMAAALQDYKRAIIVGSPATFGKGTVQRMIDLDMLVQTSESGIKPLGAMKLTTQKFYRIDGGATQLKGVTPDIILPDRYAYIDFGEKDLDNPMAWSKIPGVKYDVWNGAPTSLQQIISNSEKRVQQHEAFGSIDAFARKLKTQRENTTETLNLIAYTEKQKQRKTESDAFNKILEKKTGLDVVMTVQDAGMLAQDTLKARIMNEWIDALKSDIYLDETTLIIGDILNPKQSAKAKKK
jgi:carboxyl-terminal processing protease